jgi:hypothetical protein
MPEGRDALIQKAKQAFPWYAEVIDTPSNFPMYDHLTREGFPAVRQLREGIILGSIADALWQGANQGSFAGHQWDGDTYIHDNQQGERWAVAFTPKGVVAVFYSSESDRNPFPEESPPYCQAKYFQGMPDDPRMAKERALSWMTNLEWGAGGPNAVITSAMWTDGERFTANEPWEFVFSNSLYACYMELLPLDVALLELQDGIELRDDDVVVLRSLYSRRIASSKPKIPVLPEEMETFTRTRDSIGISAARAALAAIGIELGFII